MTISLNMIVAVFAMFGVGYYVGMQYSDNKTTVSIRLAVHTRNDQLYLISIALLKSSL